MVYGLPHGATLSAGAATGDGSWLLVAPGPRGLWLTPPSGWTLDLALEVAAITIQDRDGDLASASDHLRSRFTRAERAGPRPDADRH